MKEAAESNLATYVMLRRADIEDAMTRYFSHDGDAGPSAEDDYAARRLVDVLIEAMCGRASGLSDDVVESIPGVYLSKFGDGLVPILKDLIAEEASPLLLSRAIDGYWRAIRASRSR
ncbi:hypothetical protein [Novosphingobium sp. JCM 18896]|uniref:hypothetical protein n=1 Tax=Novosphingobium sp. JCM 18896 TaxID=2989731 RepID=UPI002221AAF6|nr:hypothetical protein [Novosphingobium sp. JCM 18896]MCW1431736.1 hypothetical protein [Novosphingobium sp. JCM 18896]